MAEFVKISSIDEIPKGGMKAFEINHHRIVICHTEDGIYAVADECTHDYVPMSTGRLLGNELICLRHGARFDIKTGEVKAPPAIVGLDTYEIKVENNDIYVLLDR